MEFLIKGDNWTLVSEYTVQPIRGHLLLWVINPENTLVSIPREGAFQVLVIWLLHSVPEWLICGNLGQHFLLMGVRFGKLPLGSQVVHTRRSIS